jgi:hypothetical protein
MAQSYKNRFEGKEREISDAVDLEGYLPAARTFGVETPGVAWVDYCREILGHEPIPTTKFSLSDIAGLSDHIVSALLRRLQTQENEITQLKFELSQFHQQRQLSEGRIKRSGVDLMRLLSEAKG